MIRLEGFVWLVDILYATTFCPASSTAFADEDIAGALAGLERALKTLSS